MNKTERNVLIKEIQELAGYHDAISVKLFSLAAKLEETEPRFCRRNRRRLRSKKWGGSREGDTDE